MNIVAWCNDKDPDNDDEYPYTNDIIAFTILFRGIFPAKTSDFIDWWLLTYFIIKLMHYLMI